MAGADQSVWRRYGADILWVFALMLFVALGAPPVPFHPDESTQIMMSRDYHYQFVAGDWSQVLYTDPPLNATEQHLRLLNGTLSKYLIGLAWDLGGYTVDDLNEQWLWGADYAWNVANGHRPTDALLRTARWSQVLAGALAVPVMFALGWLWRRRWTAYPASFLLATHGVVLIHIRRAYMEATLLLFSLLVALAAVWWARRVLRGDQRRQPGPALVLGMVAGLAVASKHSGAIPVGAAFLGLAIVMLWRARGTLGWLAGSGVLALAVFLALNPAWWSDPLARAGEVLTLRAGLVADQVSAFPEAVYPDFPARVMGLLGQLSVTEPAYYEVPGWGDYLAAEIAAYEATPLAGIRYGAGMAGKVAGLALLALAAGGIALLVRDGRRQPELLVVALWGGLTVLFTLATIPLDWQRYIMPLYPVAILLAAGSLGGLAQVLLRR